MTFVLFYFGISPQTLHTKDKNIRYKNKNETSLFQGLGYLQLFGQKPTQVKMYWILLSHFGLLLASSFSILSRSSWFGYNQSNAD